MFTVHHGFNKTLLIFGLIYGAIELAFIPFPKIKLKTPL